MKTNDNQAIDAYNRILASIYEWICDEINCVSCAKRKNCQRHSDLKLINDILRKENNTNEQH